MTLKDFLDRVDVLHDENKMLIWSDGIGWSNLEIEINDNCINLLPCKSNSPFSSDN